MTHTNTMLWYLLAIVPIGLCGVWLAMAWLKAKRLAGIWIRIAPALPELGEFYALLDLNTERSHFMERHGPLLFLTEIRIRAETGVLPGAILSGRPVDSARWLTHKTMLRAIQSALHHWSSGARPSNGVFSFEFGETIGEGYTKQGSTKVSTSVANVIVRDGKVITAYPLLRGTKLAGHPLVKEAQLEA